MASKHAIIIIKNQNEYLQYYEETWHNYLFLNCKVTTKDDIANIKKLVQEKLNIEPTKITYLFNKIHSKYSVKHDMIREYEHFFYLVDLDLKDLKNKEEFIINDIKYKWFTMQKLEENKEIMKINGDIIGYVKNWFKE